LIGQSLFWSAGAGLVALAGFVGLALLNGLAAVPIYQVMAGLGAVVVLGLGAAGLWARNKAGPAPGAPKAEIAPVKTPPGAWMSAILVGLVLVGSGGATAVGLEDMTWLGLSIAASALYALFVLRPQRAPMR
jgi:hypothetical protein